MRSPFFSTFSVFIALAAIIPVNSVANTSVSAQAPSAQPEDQGLAFKVENNDELTPDTK